MTGKSQNRENAESELTVKKVYSLRKMESNESKTHERCHTGSYGRLYVIEIYITYNDDLIFVLFCKQMSSKQNYLSIKPCVILVPENLIVARFRHVHVYTSL